MSTVAWIIAIELAVGLVVVGWFGLQVALLNARIMNAVVGHQTKLLELLDRTTHTVASIRIGAEPLPPTGQDVYHGQGWVPPDRPVGSS